MLAAAVWHGRGHLKSTHFAPAPSGGSSTSADASVGGLPVPSEAPLLRSSSAGAPCHAPGSAGRAAGYGGALSPRGGLCRQAVSRLANNRSLPVEAWRTHDPPIQQGDAPAPFGTRTAPWPHPVLPGPGAGLLGRRAPACHSPTLLAGRDNSGRGRAGPGRGWTSDSERRATRSGTCSVLMSEPVDTARSPAAHSGSYKAGSESDRDSDAGTRADPAASSESRSILIVERGPE
jgi:hypothetical protein